MCIGVAGGDSVPIIGALLGHADSRTTRRSAHLTADPLRAAADRIAGTIAQAMKGASIGVSQVHPNAGSIREPLLLLDSFVWFHCTPYDQAKAEEPDWIWLPNAVVTGAADERPPVELIRQCQDVMLLRLFVDLYHAQSLANDSGIHWRKVRREFKREKTGQRGAMTVWGFQADTLKINQRAPA